jgi:hypothetical protein
VDSHVIQPHEYDDAPDLSTPYWRAKFDAVIKKQRGRPVAKAKKRG